MPQIDHIQDIDTLRQAARLLERENDRLHAKIRQLTEEISRLRGEEAGNAQKELAFLKELLRQRESALFGDSSERRRGPRSPSSGNGREKTGHGPRAQPELPMVEEFHDLEDRECPVCGGDLREMSGQTEDSEEITVVERRFILVKQRRRKYRCQCNASVVTAPGPDKLTPGGRYTPAFAVEVASSKYLDHLPLERQVKIMGREGLMVESQTLWDQLNVLAHHLQPTYEALGESVLSSPVVFADETWWRLMDGKAPKRRGLLPDPGQPREGFGEDPSERVRGDRDGGRLRSVLGSFSGWSVVSSGELLDTCPQEVRGDRGELSQGVGRDGRSDRGALRGRGPSTPVGPIGRRRRATGRPCRTEEDP
jgi:transposase